jgi:hypothetical protein
LGLPAVSQLPGTIEADSPGGWRLPLVSGLGVRDKRNQDGQQYGERKKDSLLCVLVHANLNVVRFAANESRFLAPE